MASAENNKTIVLKVDGMTCGHCEMKVHGAIAEIDGVMKVKVNRKKSSAVAKLEKGSDLEAETLIHAVEEAGYAASPA